MSKGFVDELIRNMKLAGLVSKASPWMVEGRQSINKTNGESPDKQVHVRFVGFVLKEDWLEIFSEKDNLLLKFVIDKSTASIEYYIANTTPFTKIISREFADGDKWEHLLGEVKRRLKKDKSDVLNHTEQLGNIYLRIQRFLK
jgi:hypothetical protein